jgi:hypothetical protein
MIADIGTKQVIDDSSTDSALDDSTISLQDYPTSGTRAQEDEGEVVKPEGDKEEEDMSSWAGQPAIKGSSETMRMALLTFSMIGLQYVFSIETEELRKLTVSRQIYVGY